MEMEKSKSYIITWYCNAVKIGRSSLNVAVCEKTGCVSHLSTSGLNPIMVHNVYVSEDGCQDGEFCVNVDCPLCKKDLHYWRTHGIETVEDLQKLHTEMEKIREELQLQVKDRGMASHYEKAPISYRKKR
jgi:glutaredoxin